MAHDPKSWTCPANFPEDPDAEGRSCSCPPAPASLEEVRRQPVREVLVLLRRLLREAAAGKLRAVAYSAACTDGDFHGYGGEVSHKRTVLAGVGLLRRDLEDQLTQELVDVEMEGDE